MLFKGDSSGEREVLQIDVFASYFAVKYRSILFVSCLSTCKFMKRCETATKTTTTIRYNYFR